MASHLIYRPKTGLLIVWMNPLSGYNILTQNIVLYLTSDSDPTVPEVSALMLTLDQNLEDGRMHSTEALIF